MRGRRSARRTGGRRKCVSSSSLPDVKRPTSTEASAAHRSKMLGDLCRQWCRPAEPVASDDRRTHSKHLDELQLLLNAKVFQNRADHMECELLFRERIGVERRCV
jgi:hypothetical protein